MEARTMIYGTNCGNYEALAHRVMRTLGLKDFSCLDTLVEYFRVNIPAFKTYSYVSDEYTEYSFISGAASSYIMRTSFDFRKIKFFLNNTISVLRALNSDQELMLFFHEINSLNGEPFDKRYFKKQYINEKGAFYEVFFPEGNCTGSIVTEVYDREKLRQAMLQVEDMYPGLAVTSNMSFVSSVAKHANLKPEKKIMVYSIPDGGYGATIFDSDGNEISCENIYGSTLYNAYYEFMVKERYFSDVTKQGKFGK